MADRDTRVLSIVEWRWRVQSAYIQDKLQVGITPTVSDATDFPSLTTY